MLPGQFPQQFPQRFAPLLHRQHLCDVTRNRTRFPGTDFLVAPRDLIPRKTDRNLRPVHTGIIPARRFVERRYSRTMVCPKYFACDSASA